jgi:asparagine synthase (glutamine-hydrolysing)
VYQPEFQRQYAGQLLELGAGENIQERQKTDLTYSSLPALLHYEDRNSMAHSIETRLPFLDYELVGFLVNCPSSLKLRNGWSKWILREALKGTLPEKVRLRKTKLGFNTPQAKWMREGLQNGILDNFMGSELRMGRFLLKKRVVDELAGFLHSGWKSLEASLLFRVLSLELWARAFKVG